MDQVFLSTAINKVFIAKKCTCNSIIFISIDDTSYKRILQHDCNRHQHWEHYSNSNTNNNNVLLDSMVPRWGYSIVVIRSPTNLQQCTGDFRRNGKNTCMPIAYFLHQHEQKTAFCSKNDDFITIGESNRTQLKS